MSEKFGVVYIIKNFVNNKKYVGKTENSPQERFSQHIRESKNKNRKEYHYCISRAIRKYGEEAFDYAILADDIPMDILDLVEEHYIDMYNTTDPEYGYNMSSGNYDTSNFKKYHQIRDDEEEHYDDISDEEINDILAEF